MDQAGDLDYSYVYILTTDGDVWSAGYGANGQLGQGDTAGGGAQSFGKVLRNNDGAKVVSISCLG